jgi:hypothetical protein
VTRWLLLLLSVLVGCSDDHEPSTGIMLSLTVPPELEDLAVGLRVRLGSGPEGEPLQVRDDKRVNADEWPAEVFIVATDAKRVWAAEAWALDARGDALAHGTVEGAFVSGSVRTVRVQLEGGEDQDVSTSDAGPLGTKTDAGMGRLDAGGRPEDAGAADARQTQGSDSGARDATTTAPADSGIDAAAIDAAVIDARARDDGGSLSPDAGSAESCAPDYPRTNECQRCTCANCSTAATSCFAGNDEASNAKCRSIQECTEQHHCAGDTCYCGASLLCLNPDGPCKTEIGAAAGAGAPLDVQNATNTPGHPVKLARDLSDCQTSACRAECGL